MDNSDKLKELIKQGVIKPDTPSKPRFEAVRKVDKYEKNKVSKMGIRRSMSNWQQDNLLEFMDTWSSIEDKAMKARLYLDSLQYTLGKIGSVDLNIQTDKIPLEQRLVNIIKGNTDMNLIEDVQDENEKENI